MSSLGMVNLAQWANKACTWQNFNEISSNFRIVRSTSETSKEIIRDIAMNALSYLPVGGIYTGTKKIQAALTSIKLQKMTENPQKYSTYNHTRIVRGVVEILGAGSLFLIPDVIASLSRSAARVSRQFAQAIAMSG